MKPQPTLETPRLHLRPFVPGDADRVRALVNDELVYRWTLHIPHPYTLDDAQTWIAAHQSHYFAKEETVFAVCSRQSELVVGCVGLVGKPEGGTGEVGYWVGRDFWGRGFCTEAVREVLSFGFGELGYHKIRVRCFKGNAASERVIGKLDFVREGELVDEIKKDGAFITILTFRLLEGEFRQDGR